MVYRALTLFNTLKQDILNDDVIEIKGVKIPNFFKQDYNLQFEFCHQFIELYQDFILQPRGLFAYESEELSISNNDVVFDCGANMGLFAAYAASKGATVYCFEPCSSTRVLLEQTQHLYPHNIRIYPYAIGGCTDIATLYHTDNIGANHLSQYDVNKDNEIMGYERVPVITIDNFVADTGIVPTIIKMDIEGAEIDAIRGGIQTLNTHSPKCVIASYHFSDTEKHIRSIINTLSSKWKIEKKQDNLFLYKI